MRDLSGYRLLGIVLENDEGQNWHFVRELGDDAKPVSEALDVLAASGNHVGLFIITELNYAELDNALKEYAKGIDALARDFLTVQNVLVDLSRRLLNYLSAVRMFTDQSESTIKREFGSSSERFQRYKEYESELYDSSFAYRFLYKLRNYAQHLGLPLDSWSRSKPLKASTEVAPVS